jgi:hypothetical protein
MDASLALVALRQPGRNVSACDRAFWFAPWTTKRSFVEGDGEELDDDPGSRPLMQLNVHCEGSAVSNMVYYNLALPADDEVASHDLEVARQ